MILRSFCGHTTRIGDKGRVVFITCKYSLGIQLQHSIYFRMTTASICIQTVYNQMMRPLVETKAWDYCILWKFPNDDPSRCIKLMGCCCSGSLQGVCENVKDENVPYLCKDTYIKHLITTTACQKLAIIPSSLSLFHGIHGLVAVSKQPYWLSNDSIGTQIVVPVEGGLIELFRSKHVPGDQWMIETLISHLGVFVDHALHDDDSINSLSPYLFTVPQPITHINSQDDDKAFMTTKQKKVKESKCKSKNLSAERNRRKRIKDGLYTLRALVPRISKMNTAAILGDAIEYIIDLQKNVKELQDELKELEVQDCEVDDNEFEVKMEVHEIGAQEFLLKLICCHKPSRFLRIMETLDSLGLEVMNINITTCNAYVLNILNLKAKEKDVTAKSLRDSLVTVCSVKTI